MPILIETKITNSAVINARILAGKIFKLKKFPIMPPITTATTKYM